MSLNISLKNAIKSTSIHFSKLEKMGIQTVQDLLEYFPRTIESTQISSDMENIQLGEKNTLSGILTDITKEKTARKKLIGKAILELDDGTDIEVIWFQIPYLLKNLRDGSRVFLVGRIDRNYGKIQILNPEVHLDKGVHVGTIRAIYPESPPITSKWIRDKLLSLLYLVRDFEEIIPKEVLESEDLISRAEAIKRIHHPTSANNWNMAKRRLAFEEIFEIQVRVIQEKFLREKNRKNTFHVPFEPEQVKKDLKELPFELTLSQKRCLHAALKDMASERPMYQLMQGDVGSGKTIVSFLTALQAVRQGYQAAIMAPTEILAKQHFAGALKFFLPNHSVEILTGSVPAKKKNLIKSGLRTGSIKVIIGTHALLTEDTVFKNLGLAVIDEQHRFGVQQRAILAENNCHILAMTATPIPRTLALTIYGDQDISVINELPPGRREIITRVVADDKTRTLCMRFIEDQIEKGHQIFWICPLIDESDTIEAKNVKAEYDRISNDVFPKRRVQFLHGKMKPAEKNAVMDALRDHQYDILVSTSVIEVGVDIPNATVMVIENAERFGLAQLHQFRGRIGRNDRQSYCFLMTGKKEDAYKSRLQAMEKSNDGMYLAEVDMKLRGTGEVYGVKQSGFPDLKCADLTDVELISSAREWATKLLQTDPELNKYPTLKKRIERLKIILGG